MIQQNFKENKLIDIDIDIKNDLEDLKDLEDIDLDLEDIEDLDLKKDQKEQFFQNNQLRRKDDKIFFKNIYSAGILPFYLKNNTIFFLLGKDTEGKWSDFGGRSETQDLGCWDVTASREFYEETIGSIMDIKNILSKIQNKNSLRIKGKTMNGSPYYMYLVKIPYKEVYRINFQNTLSFISYIKYDSKNSKYNNKSIIDYKYFEKTDIQWISYENIKLSIDCNLETDTDQSIYPLRPVFKKSFENNIENIVSFCRKLCFHENNLFNVENIYV